MAVSADFQPVATVSGESCILWSLYRSYRLQARQLQGQQYCPFWRKAENVSVGAAAWRELDMRRKPKSRSDL